MKVLNLTKRAKMLIVVASATVMATLTGCGTKDDDARGDSIDGTWTATYNGVAVTLDIDSGARTYLLSAPNIASESGTYDPETGEMTSSDGESFYTAKYNKSDDTLSLTDNDGSKVVFARAGGGKKDDNSSTGGKLNPPAWLVGKWEREDHTSGEDITVAVHNVTVSSGNLDFTYQLEKKYISNFKETLNGTLYTLSYVTEHPAGEGVSYSFEPNSNGKMKLTITMTSLGTASFIYVKKK